jgi:hypothetical protein
MSTAVHRSLNKLWRSNLCHPTFKSNIKSIDDNDQFDQYILIVDYFLCLLLFPIVQNDKNICIQYTVRENHHHTSATYSGSAAMNNKDLKLVNIYLRTQKAG